jgi:hypothetical protein
LENFLALIFPECQLLKSSVNRGIVIRFQLFGRPERGFSPPVDSGWVEADALVSRLDETLLTP